MIGSKEVSVKYPKILSWKLMIFLSFCAEIASNFLTGPFMVDLDDMFISPNGKFLAKISSYCDLVVYNVSIIQCKLIFWNKIFDINLISIFIDSCRQVLDNQKPKWCSGVPSKNQSTNCHLGFYGMLKNGSLAPYVPSCEQQKLNGFNPPENCTDPVPEAVGLCLRDVDNFNEIKCFKKLMPGSGFSHFGLNDQGAVYASQGSFLNQTKKATIVWSSRNQRSGCNWRLNFLV